MEKIEKRYCASGLELRSDGEGKESRTIVGYAAVFDSDSVDMGFTERLNKNCFDGVIERSNVVALYNHSETPGILARSDKGKGTLSLSVMTRGFAASLKLLTRSWVMTCWRASAVVTFRGCLLPLPLKRTTGSMSGAIRMYVQLSRFDSCTTFPLFSHQPMRPLR